MIGNEINFVPNNIWYEYKLNDKKLSEYYLVSDENGNLYHKGSFTMLQKVRICVKRIGPRITFTGGHKIVWPQRKKSQAETHEYDLNWILDLSFI